jgi:hypothetical protein
LSPNFGSVAHEVVLKFAGLFFSEKPVSPTSLEGETRIEFLRFPWSFFCVENRVEFARISMVYSAFRVFY